MKKFDMRLYVLVTSFKPLTIYIYNNGFGRFTNFPYSLDDLGNRFVHLTNVSVQKNSEGYDKDSSGKWFVSKIRHYLNVMYGIEVSNKAFERVQMLIIDSLKSVAPIMQSDPHCFELFGFDVMFDSNLKPWLIVYSLLFVRKSIRALQWRSLVKKIES